MLLALEIVLGLALAAMGACVFSFVNVLVYRMPRQLDWVRGRSFCPSCHHQLGAGDLVPVLSWVFLRGKCRYCRAPIPVHDTIWELVGAAAALLCASVWGLGAAGVLAFALFAMLAAVAGIDHATRIIPNGLVAAVAIIGALALAVGLVPGAQLALPAPAPFDLSGLLGTATAASSTESAGAATTAPAGGLMQAAFPIGGITWTDRLIGVFAASVPLFLIALFTGGFGGGDVKLLAALGLAFGWQLVLLTLFGAVLFGGIYGIWLLATKRAGRKDAFAFGPFICAAAVIASVAGHLLIYAYLAAFGLA